MPEFQSSSTARSVFRAHEKDLAAFPLAAREHLDWREDVFGDLSRERRAEQDANPKESIASCKGLLPWQVKRVRDYVDANLHDRVWVTLAASHARLSPNYFSRCFRQSLGMTFPRFVAGRRIERAQALMIGGVDKLSQIALACGFADQAHFTRTFGNFLGCTPSCWRRRAVMDPLAVRPAGAHQGCKVVLGTLEFRAAHS